MARQTFPSQSPKRDHQFRVNVKRCVLGDYQNSARCLSVFPSTSWDYFVRTRYRLSLVVFRSSYAFRKNIHWGLFLDFPKLLNFAICHQKMPIFGLSFILMGFVRKRSQLFPDRFRSPWHKDRTNIGDVLTVFLFLGFVKNLNFDEYKKADFRTWLTDGVIDWDLSYTSMDSVLLCNMGRQYKIIPGCTDPINDIFIFKPNR